MRPLKKLKKFINRITTTRASDQKDCSQQKDMKLDSIMSARSGEASPVSRKKAG